MSQEDHRQFALRLSTLHYDAMTEFGWHQFQHSIPFFELNLANCEVGPEQLIWESRLASAWYQLNHLYLSLASMACQAYGYWQLVPAFQDSSEQAGVRWHFQMEFENFIYRLAAFRELTAQLSNVYHRQELEPEKVSSRYWDKLPIQDDFTQAVDEHLKAESVLELKQMRNQMAHQLMPDMVGCGFGALTPMRNSTGEITGFGLGARPKNHWDYTVALPKMESAFSQVTQLLARLEPLVKNELTFLKAAV